RRDIGSGAEETFDRRHRVDRESGGEDGFAEGVSGLAVEPAVVFEPFADPGGDDLGVEVGVVAGGIPGGEDVTEVGGAVPGRTSGENPAAERTSDSKESTSVMCSPASSECHDRSSMAAA